jgi:hypothetical protein
MPVSTGNAASSFRNASRPPADAPIPTTGKAPLPAETGCFGNAPARRALVVGDGRSDAALGGLRRASVLVLRISPRRASDLQHAHTGYSTKLLAVNAIFAERECSQYFPSLPPAT